MVKGSIILNTESQGVIYFSIDQLMKQEEQLQAKDHKTLCDQQPSGYRVIRLFTDSSDGDLCLISESESENKTSI